MSKKAAFLLIGSIIFAIALISVVSIIFWGPEREVAYVTVTTEGFGEGKDVTEKLISVDPGDSVAEVFSLKYKEYYEFFENSMLIGVPDFVPKAATDGDVTVLPAAFGLLNASLLNVSKVKTGYVTCARLVYLKGKYKMHVYTATAKTPPAWNEFGWDDPAPQLPSLEVCPDSCTVEEFAQNVSGQHVIVAYGNYVEAIRDFCNMMDIELVM